MRLDYLQSLGIKAIILGPVFPSPMVDYGYDVSNYTDVDEIFGSLVDFDHLIVEVHNRGRHSYCISFGHRYAHEALVHHQPDVGPFYIARLFQH